MNISQINVILKRISFLIILNLLAANISRANAQDAATVHDYEKNQVKRTAIIIHPEDKSKKYILSRLPKNFKKIMDKSSPKGIFVVYGLGDSSISLSEIKYPKNDEIPFLHAMNFYNNFSQIAGKNDKKFTKSMQVFSSGKRLNPAIPEDAKNSQFADEILVQFDYLDPSIPGHRQYLITKFITGKSSLWLFQYIVRYDASMPEQKIKATKMQAQKFIDDTKFFKPTFVPSNDNQQNVAALELYILNLPEN